MAVERLTKHQMEQRTACEREIATISGHIRAQAAVVIQTMERLAAEGGAPA